MPTIQIKSMPVAAVYCTVLERSTEFYCNHLGFEKVQEMPPGILLKAGEIMLYIEANRTQERPKYA